MPVTSRCKQTTRGSGAPETEHLADSLEQPRIYRVIKVVAPWPTQTHNTQKKKEVAAQVQVQSVS